MRSVETNLFPPGKGNAGKNAGGPRDSLAIAIRWFGWAVAWAWTIVAGGGGAGLLVTLSPWPPTNGWFALFSGISACPLTAWLLKRYAGWRPSGWVRFAAAALFILAGRIALAVEGRPFLPHV